MWKRNPTRNIDDNNGYGLFQGNTNKIFVKKEKNRKKFDAAMFSKICYRMPFNKQIQNMMFDIADQLDRHFQLNEWRKLERKRV